MTTLQEAAADALDTLEHIQRCIGFEPAIIHQGSATWRLSEDAIEGLRTALAQQGEPVAVVAETWGHWPNKGSSLIADWTGDAPPVGTKLFTRPPASAVSRTCEVC